MEIKSFKRDSQTIETGMWVDEIPGMKDLRLKVRGLSTPEVASARARKEMAEPRDSRNKSGQLKTDIAMRLFGEVLAEVVLLDWDNVTENGKPLKYDLETAKKWCTEPDFMPFADAVTWAAGRVDQHVDDASETLVGNSNGSSSGKSNTDPDTDA